MEQEKLEPIYEDNTLENTYENKNPLTRTYFRWKINQAIKLAGLRKDDVILDYGCFPKGTLIYDDKLNQIPIENIKIDDKIMTVKGNFKNVVKTFKRKYNGEVFTIFSPYGYLLSSTEEHPILSIKRGEVGCNSHGNKSQRTCNTNSEEGKCSMCNKENKYTNPRYRSISSLKTGDYVAIPRNIRSNVKSINDENIRLARLLGWYLAEGNVMYSHKPKIGGITFCLGENETEYAEEIKDLAMSLGATSVTIYKREVKNIIIVNCFSKKLAEEILKLGGRYSYGKELNPIAFNWSKEEHINLLQAYFLGDGHYRKGEYAIKSVSKKLIQQIRLIFNKYGICPGYNAYEQKERRKYYSLILAGNDVSFLKNSNLYPSKKRYRVNEDYIFIPITRISHETKELDVYNLEVEGEHTYIASGICVHNCGGGWLEKVLSRYKIYGYDINPKKTFIKDYKTVKPDKIFLLDVLEHISLPDIQEILDSLKGLNDNFKLVVSIPTENFISRKMRKLVGKTEIPKEHITKYREILNILKKNFKLKKKINFFTVTHIFLFEK